MIDIKTRDGNKTRFAGMINTNPFVSKGIFEAPIIKLSEDNGSSLSFLMTVKHSYLNETSPFLYGYANEMGVLPYNFTDGHIKLSYNASNGSKLAGPLVSITPIGCDSKIWQATIGPLQEGVLISRFYQGAAKFVMDGAIAYSTYGSSFLEDGNSSKVRRSDVGSFNGNINFSYYLPKSRVFNFGVEVNSMTTEFEYSTTNDVNITQGGDSPQSNVEAGLFAHFKGRFGTVVIEPSVRLQAYASLGEVRIEPRLGLKWNITDWLRFKAAGGMYSQNLISSGR